MTLSPKKRIFVTGGSGLLGWTLSRFLPHSTTLYQFWRHPLPANRQSVKLDLRDRQKLLTRLDHDKPEIIINTAAMTDPVICEHEPRNARILNGDLPGWLAAWAEKDHARLVQISTDLVFDGIQGNYRETDAPNPVSVYGETKLAGETQALQSCMNAVVLRLSIMGGTSLTGRRGLNEVIAAAALEQKSVQLFTDEFRSAIWADNVAEIILELMDHDFTGLLHVPGGKNYSRYEIGKLVFQYYGFPVEKLNAVQIADFTGMPPRCPDVTLSGSLYNAVLKTCRRDFRDGFQQYLPGSEN